MPKLRLALIFSAFWMPAISLAETNWSDSRYILVGTDDSWYIPAAVDNAVDTFIGAGGGAFALSVRDAFLNSDGSGIDYRIKPNASLQVGLGYQQQAPLQQYFPYASKGQIIKRSVTAVYGLSEFTLPDGAGILVEPIDLTFQNLSIEAAIDAEMPILGQAGALFKESMLSVGVGLQVNYSHSWVRSPVLAFDSRTLQKEPFLRVSFKKYLGKKQPNAAFLTLKKAKLRNVSLQTGLAVNF